MAEEENSINKFTILGETGSGKTCYLLGMYFEMSAGVAGYTLTTENPEDDRTLSLRYEMLNDKGRGQSRFPDPSDSVQKYNFHLQYAFEDILPFEWIDYPGGWLDARFKDTNNAQYRSVEKNIKESDILFIVIDGANLVGNNTENKIKRVKRKCARNIAPYLGSFNGKLPPITMIVTKYDICLDDTNPDEVKEIIQESFEGLFARDDVFISIIPVSLGETLQDDDFQGELEPLNIQLPILMGIDFALIDILKYAKIVIESDKDYVRQTEQLKRQEEDRWAITRWLFGGYDPEELGKNIESVNKTIKNNKKIAKYFKKSLSRVSRDLEDVKAIFFNGSWQDRRNIRNMWDNLHSIADYF